MTTYYKNSFTKGGVEVMVAAESGWHKTSIVTYLNGNKISNRFIGKIRGFGSAKQRAQHRRDILESKVEAELESFATKTAEELAQMVADNDKEEVEAQECRVNEIEEELVDLLKSLAEAKAKLANLRNKAA